MKAGLNTTQKRRRTIAVIFMSLLMLSRTSIGVTTIFANVEQPKAPSAPEAPAAPTAPETPSELESAPEAPTKPTAPEAPTAPSSIEEMTSRSNSDSAETTNQDSSENQSASTSDVTPPANQTNSTETSNTSAETSNQQQNTQNEDSKSAGQNSSTGITQNGQSGSTVIDTGDANVNGSSVALANTNISSTEETEQSSTSAVTQSSVQSVISDNGSDSTNHNSISIADNSDTSQTNQAQVQNGLDLTGTTGDNSASYNLVDSTIVSGDANVTGSVVNAVNTNVDGVMVAEFNVLDNHTGDLVLDFAQNCVIGCSSITPSTGAITSNGSDSTNTTTTDVSTTDNTFQNNDANVVNNVTLVADTGSNQASYNTDGDSVIQTGDANVVANVINLLNTNVAGEVLIGVVNIFGELVGNILLPADLLAPPATGAPNGSPAAVASIDGNGSASDNTITVDQIGASNTFQTNDAYIENNLVFNAQTGGNQANYNTGGNTAVVTGDANIDGQAVTVANTNISGGTWYLVLINNAGQWIGQIIGAPAGSPMAFGQIPHDSTSSDNTTPAVQHSNSESSNNEISDNGSGSDNTVAQTSTSTDTTTQSNQATLINNLNLAAFTGNNQTSYNTGGNSIIMTGDANIVANLLNLVNTNIASNGRLVVTFINILGSWTGDFLSPGTEAPAEEVPEDEDDSAIGGTDSPTIEPETIWLSSEEDSTEDEWLSDAYDEMYPDETVSTFVPQTRVGAVLGEITETPQLAMNQIAQNLSDPAKKTVKVNLAWLLTLMPLGPLAFVLRRTYFD